MSKVDDLRALREARYAAASRPSAPKTAVAAPAGKPPAAPVRKAARTAAVVVDPSGELCGHRSMNGRSCTRDSGHAEKNHRYG